MTVVFPYAQWKKKDAVEIWCFWGKKFPTNLNYRKKSVRLKVVWFIGIPIVEWHRLNRVVQSFETQRFPASHLILREDGIMVAISQSIKNASPWKEYFSNVVVKHTHRFSNTNLYMKAMDQKGTGKRKLKYPGNFRIGLLPFAMTSPKKMLTRCMEGSIHRRNRWEMTTKGTWKSSAKNKRNETGKTFVTIVTCFQNSRLNTQTQQNSVFSIPRSVESQQFPLNDINL